ncbi:MAG: hypothetical protein J6U56_08730 [Spirochaetia bacterium]|nr:hypothetical protein [Spirochaetia bacterium]
MRLRLWSFTAILILLISGCSNKGESLTFFYDKDFGQVAELAPALFLGQDKPFFKELSRVSLESGYKLEPFQIDIQEEDYLNSFKSRLPQHNKKLVITSFLYTVPDIQEALSGFQVAVVGAALDIPLDKLKVIGNGFRVIEDEGRMLVSAGQKIRFVALKSGFQQLITDAFIEGSGSDIMIYTAELNAKMLPMPQSDELIVASYGPCFKSFSSPQFYTGAIRVLNYPADPEYADPYMKKKVEAYICYDFATSFKSAILELASGRGEKKSFYSFDLVRR